MTTAGDVIAGRYRVQQLVASGGMGAVWRAEDELLQRTVAVKEVYGHPGLSDDETVESRTRVMREARMTARLHHPNAVTLYDVVEVSGRPCLIMQFVPSRSLSAVLREVGVLDALTTARVGAQIAAALAAAHRVGVVHRDVKPGNVLITDDGSAKLTDFGISYAVGDVTLTPTGLLTGTPAFLAPEVARGQRSSFPADVFSLGATLFAALEGTPPFGRDPNPIVTLHRAAAGAISWPAQRGPLTPLLTRMLKPESGDRPSAVEVASTLETLAERIQVEAATRPLIPVSLARASRAVDAAPESPTRGAANGPWTLPESHAPGEAAAAVPAPTQRLTLVEAPASPAATVVEEPVAPTPTLVEEPAAPSRTLVEAPATPPRTLVEEPAAPPLTLVEATAAPPPALVEATAAAIPTVVEAPLALTDFLVEPAPAPDRRRRRLLVARALVAAAVALVVLGVVWIAAVSRDQGGQPSAADPASTGPASTSTAAEPAPSALAVPLTTAATESPASASTPSDSGSSQAVSSQQQPDVESSATQRNGNVDESEAPAAAGVQSPAPSTTSSASSAPAVTSGAAQPASASAPTSAPTSAELAQFLDNYYAPLPGDRDAGWEQLTARYRSEIAHGRDAYERFWTGVAAVAVTDVVGVAPDQAEATLTYYFTDGRVVVERTSYQIVREDGTLKFDYSTVLTSATQ